MKNFIRYLIVIGFCLSLIGLDFTKADDLEKSLKSSTLLRRANQNELDVSFKPLNQNGNEITLELSLKGIEGPINGEMKIHIQVGKNIVLKSPETIKENFKNDQEKKYTVEIYVPKGVSSSVSAFTFSNSYPIGGRSRLFIRNIEDSMEFSIFPFPVPKVVPLYQKPNIDTMTFEQLQVGYEMYVELKDKEKYDYFESITDTLIPTYINDVFKTTLSYSLFGEIGKRGYGAEFVHRPPWDKRTTPWKNLETPPKTKVSNVPKILTERMTEAESFHERKHQAEKYVLTDKPQESFYIDNVLWQRNRGEQYFRVIEPITDTKAYTQHINDSLEALPDNHFFNLCLIISDDKKADALTILGNLPEPVAEIFYHLKVKKGDIPKLDKAGIRLSYKFNSTCDHKRSSSTIDSKKN